MTDTIDDAGERTESAAFPPPPPRRPLRRSRTDRAGIGLCGGLGDYFAVDPVLFRVLFVVLSFFGGIGIFAYLAGYALVPEEGVSESGADRLVAQLRRRRISPLVVAAVAGLLLWAGLFSWWLPDSFPATLVLVGLFVYLAMRHRGDPPPPPPGSGRWPPPDPASTAVVAPPAAPLPEPSPQIDHQASTWRARRRPVLVATLAALVIVWGGLALLDMATAVPLKVFAWSGLAIVLAGIVAGLLWRRLPLSLLVLAVAMVAAVAMFGASEARLDDGVGDAGWTPSSPTELRSQYALAFGRSILDLTDPSLELSGQSIRVDHGAGEVVIRVPADVEVTFAADVQAGAIDVDGQETGGWAVEHRERTGGAAEGGPSVAIDVELGAGAVRLERVP